MNKIHVLWINEKADFTGGCEQYVFNTANLLKKYNVKSSILYGISGWTDPVFIQNFEYAFPIVDIPNQIKEINPDLIYVHSLFGRDRMEQLIATGKPVIRFFHDHKLFCLRDYKYKAIGHRTCNKPIGLRCYPCLGFINRSDNWMKIKFSNLHNLKKEQNTNKKINAFVVGSKYMAEHMIEHGFSREKMNVIPLYTQKSSVENVIDPEKNLLLFAGQLIRGKGLDTLLKAMSYLDKKVKLIICGSGRQEHVYRKMVKRFNLTKRVVFKSKISKRMVSEFYQKAAVVIMPSRSPETFGLVGLEAMKVGKPVIASDVGGINEWLENGKTGLLVPSNDSKGLADAIEKLLNDKNLLKTMEINARKSFIENFQPENHLKKLRKLFDFIIEEEQHDK